MGQRGTEHIIPEIHSHQSRIDHETFELVLGDLEGQLTAVEGQLQGLYSNNPLRTVSGFPERPRSSSNGIGADAGIKCVGVLNYAVEKYTSGDSANLPGSHLAYRVCPSHP